MPFISNRNFIFHFLSVTVCKNMMTQHYFLQTQHILFWQHVRNFNKISTSMQTFCQTCLLFQPERKSDELIWARKRVRHEGCIVIGFIQDYFIKSCTLNTDIFIFQFKKKKSIFFLGTQTNGFTHSQKQLETLSNVMLEF